MPLARALPLLACTLAVLVYSQVAHATGDPEIAALQVGLREGELYAGPIHGVLDTATSAAIRELERNVGLAADGLPDPELRRALGQFGEPALGSRLVHVPAAGWDVGAIQFLLAWRGFPSGPFTGEYTERTAAAVRRFQRWAKLPVDGVVGSDTLSALRAAPPSSPLALTSPLPFPETGFFGPRGDRFHTGIDVAAPAGSPVSSAGPGRVAYAGWHPGGWGYLVTVAHGRGVRTMYAHLSEIAVRVGDRIGPGRVVGAVGSSGSATGAHLHFEVRLRGAAVDPHTALG